MIGTNNDIATAAAIAAAAGEKHVWVCSLKGHVVSDARDLNGDLLPTVPVIDRDYTFCRATPQCREYGPMTATLVPASMTDGKQLTI